MPQRGAGASFKLGVSGAQGSPGNMTGSPGTSSGMTEVATWLNDIGGDAATDELDATTFDPNATQPNDVADDGEPGQNGIYTKHLLRYITQPRLSLLDFFSEVSQAVRQETSGKQKPWTSFSSVPRI